MKTKTLALFGIIGMTLLFSVNNTVFPNSKTDNGIIKEERTVEPFSKISLGISANLYLTQSSTRKVVIEGEENLLANIETEVSGSTLKIKYDKSWKFKSLKKVKIYISIPDIEGLNISGSGSIVAQNAINSDRIDFSISGSGHIKIEDLNVNEIYSRISGSGDIIISGTQTVKLLDIAISGSGDLGSEGLKVEELEVRISGSGSCEVYVISKLVANISGSGKILYAGKPVVNARISGSGKIKSVY